MKILVVDSGIGGFTVAEKIYQKLKNIQIDYLADTSFAPYGEKNEDQIKQRATEILNHIVKSKYDLIVIACNTLSILAKEQFRAVTKTTVIDVFTSTQAILTQDTGSSCLVLGSGNTIRSQRYETAIRKEHKDTIIISVDGTPLVNLIEDVELDCVDSFMTQLSKSVDLAKVDTLIMACTHFPLIEKRLTAYFKKSVKIISSSFSGAIEAVKYLDVKVSVQNKVFKNELNIFTTGDKNKIYKQLIAFDINNIVGDVHKISF